jgi:hypothetical protein
MNRVLALAFGFGVLAFGTHVPAGAQESAKGKSSASPSAATAPGAARTGTGGRPASAKVSGPGYSNLSKKECNDLGGSLQSDTTCKNAQRCVVKAANGVVYSVCIDEANAENKSKKRN